MRLRILMLLDVVVFDKQKTTQALVKPFHSLIVIAQLCYFNTPYIAILV